VEPAALELRQVLGRLFERTLWLVPVQLRAPLATTLLRATPRRLRRSVVGRSAPTLRASDALPIADGPLRGARWIPQSGLHACLEGTYEEENQRLLQEHLRHGDVVYDVGANVGFFTLLGSRLVGTGGRVVAFEPFPVALEYLNRHLELNGIDNVTVIEAAVSEAARRASFREDPVITMGRLVEGGDLEVDVVSLDEIYIEGELPPPDLIKIDVEGEELKVLRGASLLLRDREPMILLATHGSVTHRACCELLHDHGYELEELPYETTTPSFDYLGELVATRAGLNRRSSEITSGTRHIASGT
jgi:FkbM family methyltransferase